MKEVFSNNKKKNLLQGFALTLLIIIFPLASWYYLQTGFAYQKAAYAELMDYGSVPNFSFANLDEKTITQDDLKEKTVVVGFFSRNEKDSEILMKELKKLHRQFDDREDVIFVMYHLNPSSDDTFVLKDFANRAGIQNWKQCFFLSGGSEKIQHLLKSTFKIPLIEKGRVEDGKYPLTINEKETYKNYPYFALIDTRGTIRNYYDMRKEDQVKRLVEHLAILMPGADREKRSN